MTPIEVGAQVRIRKHWGYTITQFGYFTHSDGTTQGTVTDIEGQRAWVRLEDGRLAETLTDALRKLEVDRMTYVSTKIIHDRATMVTPFELREHEGFDVDKEFDYLTADDDHTPRFVKVHDDWMDMIDVMPAEEPWHAYIGDTFFSRYVIRYLNGDDDGFVTVGFQMS